MVEKDLSSVLDELDIPAGTDVAELKKKFEEDENANKGGNKFSDNRFVQLPIGKTTIRILPPYVKGKVESFDSFLTHRLGGKNVTCLRLKKGFAGGKVDLCPLCNLTNWSYKKANKEDRNDPYGRLGGMLNASEKFYYNVIVRNYEPDNMEKTLADGMDLTINKNEVKILSIGKKLHAKIIEFFNNEDWGDLSHIISGYDFVIVKKLVKTPDGNWFPNYDLSYAAKNSSPLATTKEDIKEIVGKMYKLDEIIQKTRKTKEEIINAINEHFVDNEEVLDVVASGFKSASNKPNIFYPNQKEKNEEARKEAEFRNPLKTSGTQQKTEAPAQKAPPKTVSEDDDFSDLEENLLEGDDKSDEIPF
jgi:hypothetical protein